MFKSNNFVFIALFLLGLMNVSISFAQSNDLYIDLEVIQIRYDHLDTVFYEEEYRVELTVINHGPDDLLPGDDFLIKNGIFPIPMAINTGLAVGESKNLYALGFTNGSEEDEIYEYCVWVELDNEYNESGLNLIDPNPHNDSVCFSVILQGENSIHISELASADQFSIYPNPLKSAQPLWINNELSARQERISYKVYNILGQEVVSGFLQEAASKVAIELPILNTGIYYLKLLNNEGDVLHYQAVEFRK